VTRAALSAVILDVMVRLTEPVELMAQAVARRAIELVVESLDVNGLLDRVDVNRLLDNVDVNRVLDTVDVDRLLSRVDVNAVVDRVDVNKLTDRVDVNALVDRTELKTVLARSSTTVFIEGIDLVRSQAVGLDDFLARWVNRILRRNKQALPPLPLGPPRLLSLPAEP
jgi:hypothetical protein